MRNARSVAWFSTAGFHQRSKWITCDAAVRFRPEPPALSDRTKKGTDSSSWKRRTSSRRFFTSVSPCSTSPGRPNTPPRNEARGAVTSRNWVKTSAFSCLAEKALVFTQFREVTAPLGEDERLLLLGGDDLAELTQAQEK